MSSQSPSQPDSVVVVGAGVFGLSTALELRKRGYENVVVLDRAMPPVPDGASVDISRIIRIDYGDPFYTELALEALQEWQQQYKELFHQSGFALLGGPEGHPVIERTKHTLRAFGQEYKSFSTGHELKQRYPVFDGGDIEHVSGYWNEQTGWVDAEQVIRTVMRRCLEAGITFVTGPRGTVTSLVQSNNGTLVGLRVSTGETMPCSKAILATGSWTSHLIDPRGATLSTAHPVGYIQLTPDEAADLQDQPVVWDLVSGVWIFPPSTENVLKLVRHDNGFETSLAPETRAKGATYAASAPKLLSRSGNFFPDEVDASFRTALQLLLPRFQDRPWIKRRLCWYSDTRDANFIIDHHPDIKNLFLATGDSGHAFKFLPTIGRYVVDVLENRASDIQRQRWAFKPSDKPMSKGDASRAGPARRALTPLELAKL